jgi:8-oxo-dGTP pyrophosphatase MutT (NUDIX family)
VRERPSSRLLLLDAEARLLLFRFQFAGGNFQGRTFWCTPGGGVDPGESFAAAACRELHEETGLLIADPGPEIARRRYSYRLGNGEHMASDDRYFLLRVESLVVSDANWSALERQSITEHRWWSQDELAQCAERIWPGDLAELMIELGIWPAPCRPVAGTGS